MSRASTSAALAAAAALGLLAALVLVGCNPTAEKPPAPITDVRTEVRTFFESYVEALNTSDSTGVLSAYAPGAEVTLTGGSGFVRGRAAIGRTVGETLVNPGQNAYGLDSLDVVPIESAHALALVVYTVDPADQDIPAFHTTATYVLEKSGPKWQIIHAHVSPARGL